jgi:hypothetical protein
VRLWRKNDQAGRQEQSWNQVLKYCVIMGITSIPIDICAATGHLSLLLVTR